MKKTIILFIIFIILSLFVKIPKYTELNNLKIIDKINIYCDYTLLREVIPTKDDDELYEYKYYKVKKINKNKYYTDKAKVINKCIKKLDCLSSFFIFLYLSHQIFVLALDFFVAYHLVQHYQFF